MYFENDKPKINTLIDFWNDEEGEEQQQQQLWIEERGKEEQETIIMTPENEEGRPRRNRRPPLRYEDYVMNLSDDEDNEALLTYEDAIKSKDKNKWMKAIQEEIDSLNKNRTWIYVNEKEVKDKEILTSRWVFRLKDDGKYKARLVARGCFQNKNEMDYEEIYSPVVDTTPLRLLFAIAAERTGIFKDWM